MVKYASIFFFTIVFHTCFCQITIPDSSFVRLASEHAIGLYNNTLQAESHLYNGSEFIEYDRKAKGHPFFQTDMLNKGAVFYDGVLYSNVSMFYDLVNDEVVIKDNIGYRIRLVSEKVQYFSLLDHKFIRMAVVQENKTNDSLSGLGFYDLLVDKKIKVYAKRKKILYEEVTSNLQLQKEFLLQEHFYINKDNIFYPVANKSSLMRVFKDRKKELTKYMRKNKIRFKFSRENAIVKITEYYNELGN